MKRNQNTIKDFINWLKITFACLFHYAWWQTLWANHLERIKRFPNTCKLFVNESIQRINTVKSEKKTENDDPEQQCLVGPKISHIVHWGYAVIVIMIGGFFLWASLYPLASAAIAEGKITVDSNKKVIQHLEGGIVKTIYVREGNKVKKGDKLIQLEITQAKSRHKLLHDRTNALLALEARLIAERDKLNNIVFPKHLLHQQHNPNIKKIINGQINIFNTRKRSHKGETSILKKRVEQLQDEISSLRSQFTSRKTQLKFIREEITAVAYLDKRGLIEKPRLLGLKREEARLMGDRDEKLALIARTEQKIGETDLQIINIKDKFNKGVLEELRETQRELSEVLEQQKAAKDILDRTLIVSPRDGIVVNLRFHTIGGVIGKSEPILDLIPSNDELVIEAELNPLDIDVVHVGQIARVKISAFKQRHTPTLYGKVTHISADIFQEKNSGRSFYKIRISISKKELQRLKNMDLHPGMSAQVMIVTDKQTPLNYFITPIKDSFDRAFREQ